MPTRNWTVDEDAMLRHHVSIHGLANWGIAEQSIGRTENSCLIRWRDQLDPNIDHSDITDVELIMIEQLLAQYGTERNQKINWAKIAKELSEGRADNRIRKANKIKNFWNGERRKRASEQNHHILTGTTSAMPPAPAPAPAHFGYDGQTSGDYIPAFNWADENPSLNFLYQ